MSRVRAALAVIAALACIACGATAGEGADVPARTPTAPNVPHILLDQGFAPGWPDHPGSTAWLEDGTYHLFARVPGQFVAVRAPLDDTSASLQVSARFHKVGGPPGGGYGLIVADGRRGRGDGLDQSGEYVVAEVGDRGEIGVWRRAGARWVDLLPWTPSTAVGQADAANQLDVQTLGTRVVFSVNGRQVANVETGISGPGVGVFAGGDGNEVALDGFAVQPLSTGQPRPNPTAALAPVPVAPGASTPTPAVPAPPRLPDPSAFQRIEDLLLGIAEDVAAIYQSFAGGPNDPHSPVTDRAVLNEDAQRLEAAQSKAHALADELEQLQPNGRPFR